MNKVIVGNCLEVMKKMRPNSIDLIITDPPYNKNKDYGIPNIDSKPEKEFWNFNLKWLKLCYKVLKPHCHIYWSCSHDQIFEYRKIIEKTKLKFNRLLIWFTNEPKLRLSHSKWLSTYEPIFFCSKEEPRALQSPPKSLNINNFDVIVARSPHRNSVIDKKYHIAQKPLKLMIKLVAKASEPGETVLDPFCGSGTTLVACKILNRNYIGIELNPEFVKICKYRLNNIPRKLSDFT